MRRHPVYDNDKELPPQLLKARDRAIADFPYFCQAFLKIRPKDDVMPLTGRQLLPLEPFIWNEAQMRVWRVMRKQIEMGVPIRIVVCKARQVGISTLFLAWLFWQMWRSMYIHCLVSANKVLTLQNMLEMVSVFWESFPPGFRPVLREGVRADGRVPKGDMYFRDRHCWLMIIPDKTTDAGRSHNIRHAVATEVALYKDPAEFFGAFVPAMGSSPNTTMIWESSPMDGYFWELYTTARDEPEQGIAAVFLEWYTLPNLYAEPIKYEGRRMKDRWGNNFKLTDDEKREQRTLSLWNVKHGFGPVTLEQMLWRRRKIEVDYKGDQEYFDQEFPRDDKSCFERRVASAFRSCLPALKESVDEEETSEMGWLRGVRYADLAVDETPILDWVPDKHDVIDQEDEAGWAVWEHPQPGHVYVIGSDVADEANEQEEDDSCFSTMVCFCVTCRSQAGEWRGRNDPHDLGDDLCIAGYYWNEAMVNVEFNNFGITTLDRLGPRYLNYTNVFRWPKFDDPKGGVTKKMGWYTNPETKKLLIGSLRHAIKEELFKVRSPFLRDELVSYRLVEGNYEPGPGAYFDLGIGAGLAWQCVAQTDVLGSILMGGLGEHERKRSFGQAKKAVEIAAENHTSYRRPPPELPAGVGPSEDDTQFIDDYWSEAEEFALGIE